MLGVRNPTNIELVGNRIVSLDGSLENRSESDVECESSLPQEFTSFYGLLFTMLS